MLPAASRTFPELPGKRPGSIPEASRRSGILKVIIAIEFYFRAPGSFDEKLPGSFQESVPESSCSFPELPGVMCILGS